MSDDAAIISGSPRRAGATRSGRARCAGLAFVAALLATTAAHASGVDIPAIHGARYGALGGAAIALVDEPSAVFHNPAGLGQVRGLAFTGSLSLFLTALRTNPDTEDQGLETGDGVVPGFLLGSAWRLHERVVVGLGVYPVGAVGGEFRYENKAGVKTLNRQLALLVEASPAVAVQLPFDVTLGAGYRVNYLYFERVLGRAEDPATVDVEMTGWDFTGFRVGAQWNPSPYFALGAVYRHAIEIEGSADKGRLLLQPLTDIEGSLTVPSKLGVGARGRYDIVTLALDVEYVFNDQFEQITLSGTLPEDDESLEVDFLFNWNSSVTVKGGAEVVITPSIVGRAGYAYDQPATNARYPSTFSAPAADSHTVTLGGGYLGDGWAANLALGHRFENSVDIAEDDIASSGECRFCAHGGTYSARASFLFADYTIDFDGL